MTKAKESGFVSRSLYQVIDPMDFEGKPLVIDGEVVKVLKIHKKRPMELMGMDLTSLSQGKIDAVLEGLQRSCTPMLSSDDVNKLDLPIITHATMAFYGFFTVEGLPTLES